MTAQTITYEIYDLEWHKVKTVTVSVRSNAGRGIMDFGVDIFKPVPQKIKELGIVIIGWEQRSHNRPSQCTLRLVTHPPVHQYNP